LNVETKLFKKKHVHSKKRPGIEVTRKIHDKNGIPLVTFVGSLYKCHAILCSKIVDVHGIEVHEVRTQNFIFRRTFQLLLHFTIL